MDYYLKWRNDVTGPFDELLLAGQYREQKLTRFHQVSTDQVNWQPLTDLRSIHDPSYRPPAPPPMPQPPTSKPHSTVKIPAEALKNDCGNNQYHQTTFRAQRNGSVASFTPPETRDAYSSQEAVFQATTSVCATWSLILSILSLFMCAPIFCIPSLVLGYVGLSNIRHSQGRLIGQGLCVAGLIIAYISIFLWVLFAVWLFVLGGLAVLKSHGIAT